MFFDDPFFPYAKHEQEIMDIVDECVRQYNMGNTSFTINCDDYMDADDVNRIQEMVYRKIHS